MKGDQLHPASPIPNPQLPSIINPQVSHVAPFLVATGVSATTFVAFSAFFAFRVGMLDMDSAEEDRARRLGKKRVTAWVPRQFRGEGLGNLKKQAGLETCKWIEMETSHFFWRILGNKDGEIRLRRWDSY